MPNASPFLYRFALGPEAVSIARDMVADFVGAAGIARGEILAIIVEELVCNLVDHGDRPGGEIELALASADGGVRLRLSDGGAPFDPRKAPRADLPPARGGGAGLALVRAWSRIDAYERVGTRNILRLFIAAKHLR